MQYKSIMTLSTRLITAQQLIVTAFAITCALPLRAQETDDAPDEEMQYIGATGLWGDIDYDGEPWVRNLSAPNTVTDGLQGRHISVWASHGRYYDIAKARWEWQRPKLFCTTEDLFTQTIVVPYLIPMLERAGACVFTPRERDWQRNEIIIDNDTPAPLTSYIEVNGRHDWEPTDSAGFAMHGGCYHDGENPFTAGTARQAKTTSRKNGESIISYNPTFTKSGRYAVYVSYQTVKKSIDNAQYTVWHKGQPTTFGVNQKMGGGTWVYLGTFDFDEGSSDGNRVVLSNYSGKSGVVTADAVRFGGGMGNIARGGNVSGLPRCLEGSRYYAQWAGMPYDVYSSKNGQDDYGDDINARSLMTNFLGGGSVYMPTIPGRRVPIELSLALHSDAGYYTDDEVMGTLTICTTQHNGGLLSSGISRDASKTLAYQLRRNAMEDLRRQFGEWRMRYMWDRNYSESRVPEVPSAIMEMLSHQNFKDMTMAQDPNFKFAIARSVYKTILKYISSQHGRHYTVAPLTPHNFALSVSDEGTLGMTAAPTDDTAEPTAATTSYIIYKAEGTQGFDNGTEVKRPEDYRLKMQPGVLYHFRIAAANSGGVSQQSEQLSALWNPKAKARIMIINGFHRLAAPETVSDSLRQGFDIDSDPGLTLGSTFGWAGRQTNFSRAAIGQQGEEGLGWSDDSLTGMFIAGNTGDYVQCHAEALAAAGNYTVVSCQSDAVDNGAVTLSDYDAIDLLLGMERDDGHSLVRYKTFCPQMQQCLRDYAARGGAILVSGANVASDMQADSEKAFMDEVLKCRYGGKVTGATDSISGMNIGCTYWHALNEEHYAAIHPDMLEATGDGYASMIYNGIGYSAIVYNGKDYRAMTFGFPLECIKERDKREMLFRDVFGFLTF